MLKKENLIATKNMLNTLNLFIVANVHIQVTFNCKESLKINK